MHKGRLIGNGLKFGFLFIIIVSAAFIAFLAAGCSKYEKPDYYTVMMTEGIGYTVNGEAVQRINPGAPAVFDVEIHDGYEFVTSNIGSYSDGKLTIKSVGYSVTVDFVVRLSSEIASVENGTLTVTAAGGGIAKYGQQAEFCFTPYKNYVVEEVYVNGESYDFTRESNGNVIVTEMFDEYVSVRAVCLGKECNVFVGSPEFGTVNVFCDDDVVRYGDTVRVEAVPDEDYKIAYLTVDDLNLYAEYDYEFTITDNAYITARFVGDDYPIIIYEYNDGGINEDKIIEFYKAGDFMYIPNGVGYWEYEGYTLESWNTQEDGKGERHALGAMIAMPSTDTVLFAQYKKQTEADYFDFSKCTNHTGESGYAITSFADPSGSITEVVLPDSYNGKKVFAVADGAFRGNDTVWSVVTNTNIERIGNYAFAEMQNLNELYLYDSLRELSGSALSGCDSLRKLHVNSAGKRIYDKILETNVVDKQMLVKTSTNKKIVTLSGCSMAKGMDSEKIYDNEYLKDYDIINMGIHARYGLGFLMDMVNNYLNPGDIVVIALENYEHLWFTDKSNYLINSQQPGRLKHLESNYDIYEEIDFVESRDTNAILSVLPQYFSTRAQDLDSNVVLTPSPNRYDMNNHGDYTYFRRNASENAIYESPEYLYPQMKFLQGVSVINGWAQKHIARGVRFCFIYPPTFKYAAYDDEAEAQLREEFHTALKNQLIFPVIGTVDDVAMPYWCFYDHAYHPSTDGSKVYTEKFIGLLSGAIAEGVI